MDFLSRDELKALASVQEEVCVSIYLPTHRSGPETQQDPIRLKNLLSEAEQQLSTKGMRTPDIRNLLATAEELVTDHVFWRYQSDGLALFLSAQESPYYRVPLALSETVVVAQRFHIKPLFPLFFSGGRFFLLTLSQNDVQLFECTPHQIDEVSVTNMPTSLAEALKYDDPEKQFQFHTGTASGRGRRAAMFLGQGVGIDENRSNILRFFQQLDKGLHDILRNERAPLMLAGVEYLLPIYREANSYGFLVDDGVTGNPEARAAQELHQQAWAVMQPRFQEAEEDAKAHYAELNGTGRASGSLQEVAAAAYQGRVDTLFVAVGVQQWGTFHPDDHSVDVHAEAQAEDEDLLDFAAMHTFMNGGVVYAVPPEQVPGEGEVAAVFRY
ncbi:MAG: hypothetical protein AB7P18_08535 [Candidatus Binatia bacterium]